MVSFLSYSIITKMPSNSLGLFILLSFLCNRFVISADRLTPRGVPLSRAALYDPLKDFSCLDGSKLIPFSFVNDDYCDCDDGSDEPGTSACSHGSFFCLNAGYMAMNIRTSRVNDHVCDCCDGSDEFDGNISCANTCDEMGRAAREENERQIRLAREGYQKRLEMSQQGKESRKQKEEERSRLEVELQQAEGIKEDKKAAKELVEEPEKEALDRHRQQEEEQRRREDEEEKSKSADDAENMFKLMDSNDDGILTKDEIQTRQTFDRNKDGVVSDEEALFFLNMENEMSREEFLKTGWIVFKPYFLMEQGMFQPPEPETPPESDSATPPPTIDTNENSNLESPPSSPPEATESSDHSHLDYEDDELEDNKEPDLDGEVHPEDEDIEKSEGGGEIKNDLYDEATRLLIETADKAREEYQVAERTARDVSKKLQEINDSLNVDVGDDDRFAPLLGQCFDFTDREYTYSWCPFGQANQKGQGGGGDVLIGKWNSWTGPENNKYLSQLYDHGQSCWNGPNRSIKVQIQCGTDNRIISVNEPSRCEYIMEFITPAACEKMETQHHDEL